MSKPPDILITFKVWGEVYSHDMGVPEWHPISWFYLKKLIKTMRLNCKWLAEVFLQGQISRETLYRKLKDPTTPMSNKTKAIILNACKERIKMLEDSPYRGASYNNKQDEQV